MSPWIVLLAAIVLVPVVRMFMADGCTASAPPPPGTDPININVLVGSSDAPGGGVIDAQITGGTIAITPPAGGAAPIAIPPGGLFGHPVPVSAENFSGASPPYEWHISCTITFTSTTLPGNSQAGAGTILFDGNHVANVSCVLGIHYTPDTNPLGPTGVGTSAWVVSVAGG